MTAGMPALDTIRNRTFDEIGIGDSASLARTLTREDLRMFALLAGKAIDEADGKGRAMPAEQDTVAMGMWAGAWLAALLGSQLPGPGTVYRRQELRFKGPLVAGDTLTLRIEVTSRDPATRAVVLACLGRNQDGETVIEGEVDVIARDERIERERAALPDIHAADANGNDGLGHGHRRRLAGKRTHGPGQLRSTELARTSYADGIKKGSSHEGGTAELPGKPRWRGVHLRSVARMCLGILRVPCQQPERRNHC